MRAGICIAVLLLSAGAGAQEAVSERERAEIEAMEPAVDTGQPLGSPEEFEPAVDTSSSAAEAPTAPPRPASAGGTKTRGDFQAMDELDLGTTSITGNQELPKVLYIVPWKQSDLGDLVGRPVNTLLDEVLAPVDPEVFRRHLDYYDGLYGESQEE